MLKEAFEFVVGLGRAQANPVVVDADNPRQVTYLIDGSPVVVEKPPRPRSHTAGSLDEVIALANRFASETTEDASEGPPVVWYDEKHVTLVIDDHGHRADRATLTLETSDVFARLEKLARERPWLEQKAFVRMLRLDLAGTLAPVHLLDKVRRLRWESGSTTDSTVARNRESLGRSITSEARSPEGEIPEEVTLLAPVYKTPGERERHAIACAVEVDPDRGMLQLFPLPDEVERVRALALASIRLRLDEGLNEGVHRYYGRP